MNDLIKVAKELGKNAITRNEYNKYGRFSEGTLRKRFGGWLKTLEKADLLSTKDYNISEDELIKELRRIANIADVTVLSRKTFNKYKKISSSSTIEHHFGSWITALKKAGLPISRSQSRYFNEDLFENLLNVWTYYGRQPTVTEMSELPSKITPNTYSNRFGNWRKSLEAFVDYANRGESEALIDERNVESKEEIENPALLGVIHKTSRNINLRLRFLVMKNSNFKCKNCGRSPAIDPKVILHVDHIHPWAKGGETVLDNLQTLCSKCNIGKSDL